MGRLYTKRSNINGTGLYTSEPLKPGQHVGYIHGPITVFRKFTPEISKKMLDWIGVGRYSWIDTTNSPFRHINHSCEPNVAIVTKRKVIALTAIVADTELTMDYSLTEAEPSWSIGPCTCGSTLCRKTITDITGVAPEVVEKHINHMQKNFVKIYKQLNPGS